VSAWSLLLRVLTQPGDRVIVEQPSYPNALEAARRAGVRLVPVPLGDVDDRLWDLETWRAALRQSAPTLGYVVPDCQNPTGGVMDDACREGVVAAADAVGTTLVVDETLVDLRLDGRPAGSTARLVLLLRRDRRRAEQVGVGGPAAGVGAGLARPRRPPGRGPAVVGPRARRSSSSSPWPTCSSPPTGAERAAARRADVAGPPGRPDDGAAPGAAGLAVA
jgi:hypothetical protein